MFEIEHFFARMQQRLKISVKAGGKIKPLGDFLCRQSVELCRGVILCKCNLAEHTEQEGIEQI